jgi:hypothetical protein
VKGINPLLYGLNDCYGTSGSLLPLTQNSTSLTSLLGKTAAQGASISNQAMGISQLSSMLKADRNRTALAGLNGTVNALIKDTDSTVLNDFVTLGLGSVITGKKGAFSKLMTTMSSLNAQGESSLATTIVKQAAKTYTDKGSTVTGKFIDTASGLANRKYTDDDEMKSVVGGFVSTWNAIRTTTKTSDDIPDLSSFARKVDSLDNASLKAYLTTVNAAVRKLS